MVVIQSVACFFELARAKKLGAVITYDPNYRANLWKNKEDAIAQMKAPLPLVDILKVSDEELPLLTGTTDCESGTAQLAQNGNYFVTALTRGLNAESMISKVVTWGEVTSGIPDITM